jgi:hypothetical protein
MFELLPKRVWSSVRRWATESGDPDFGPYAVEVDDGVCLWVTLPRGIRATKARFPKLKFYYLGLRDREYMGGEN